MTKNTAHDNFSCSVIIIQQIPHVFLLLSWGVFEVHGAWRSRSTILGLYLTFPNLTAIPPLAKE